MHRGRLYQFLLLLILSFVSISSHADEWTSTNSKQEIGFQTLLALDWIQTRHCLLDMPGCYEQNPLLGKHPSQEKLAIAVIATSLSHVYVAHLLPQVWRDRFQKASIGIEAIVFARHLAFGIAIKF